MKYDTAIFDLDGTLIDSLEDLWNSVNHMLRQKEYPERSKEQIQKALGNGVEHLIQNSIPEGSDQKTLEECAELFKKIYSMEHYQKTVPFKGIGELLAALKKQRVKIAVASNKHEPAVKELCNTLFGGYIDVALGSEAGTRRKPAPDIVLKALEQLGADKNTSLYIGDSEVDMLTAKNAGLMAIGVTWGYRDAETLLAAGADRLVDEPCALMQWF